MSWLAFRHGGCPSVKKGLIPRPIEGTMSSSEVQTGDSSQQINEGNIAARVVVAVRVKRRHYNEIEARSNTEAVPGPVGLLNFGTFF